MKSPHGWAEVLNFFGDPMRYVGDDGRVSSVWVSQMVRVSFPKPLVLGWTVEEKEPKFARAASVHQNCAEELERVFLILEREDLWPKFRTFDGAYTWRMQRNSASKLSMHSFGAALDFDAATNKLGQVDGDINQSIVQVFESCGWTWGGRFQRPDMMHFQFATGV